MSKPRAFIIMLVLLALSWWLWPVAKAPKAQIEPVALPPPAAEKPQPKLSNSGKYISDGGMNERGQKRLSSLSLEATEAKVREAAAALDEKAPGVFQMGGIEINVKARTLSLPVTVQMQTGRLEYALVHESGKTHEALFVTTVPPQQLHIAALLLDGLQQKPSVEVTWRRNGPLARLALADLIEVAGDEPELLVKGAWHYGGSQFTGAVFAAQAEGSMVSLIEDSSALIGATGSLGRRSDDLFSPRAERLPPKGLAVTMVFSFPPK